MELARQYADEYDIDPEVFVRLITQESGGDPTALSEKGAMGIAQIMPETARDPGYGVRPIEDPFNPVEGLRFGAEYFRAMLDEFGGDYEKATAAYNAGAGAVKKYGGVPPFQETQDYVTSILSTSGDLTPPPPGPPPPRGGGEALLSGEDDEEASAMGLQGLLQNIARAPDLPQRLPTTVLRGRGGSGTSAIQRLGVKPLA